MAAPDDVEMAVNLFPHRLAFWADTIKEFFVGNCGGVHDDSQ